MTLKFNGPITIDPGAKKKKRDFQKQGLDCKMLELQ
jgi:hypothetical protein